MCMHELFCFLHIIGLYNQLFDARIYTKIWLEKGLLICIRVRYSINQKEKKIIKITIKYLLKWHCPIKIRVIGIELKCEWLISHRL